MDQHVSDEDLMVQLNWGDDQAFTTLVKRWAGPIKCFIQRMCGPLHVTDDVQQEVWGRVFAYRRSYDPSMPFRGYIFKIALNCCRTAVQREHVLRPFAGRLGERSSEEVSSGDPPPIDALIAKERGQMVCAALHSLPRMQRAVVLLYVLLNGDYRNIAEVLGKSPGTVRSHMHHALTRLRSTLNRAAQDAESQVDHERHSH